jgi:hypothetical protein
LPTDWVLTSPPPHFSLDLAVFRRIAATAEACAVRQIRRDSPVGVVDLPPAAGARQGRRQRIPVNGFGCTASAN